MRTISHSSLRAGPEIPVTVVGVGSNLLVRDGGIPGVVVRLSAKGFGQADAGRRKPDPGRRGTARQAARRLRARGGHRRLPFLPRHPRQRRRRAPHECRRQRRRDARAGGRGARYRPQRPRLVLSNASYGLQLPPFRRARRSDLHLGASSRARRKTARRSRRRWTRSSITARQRSRSARKPAARPSRTRRARRHGSDRQGRLPRADDRRRQISEMHCNFMINTGTATGYDLEF